MQASWPGRILSQLEVEVGTRWARWCVLLAAAVALALVQVSAAADNGWVALGPTGGLDVTDLAVAPNWPTSQLLLAVRGRTVPPGLVTTGLVRSLDAGQHWEAVPLPDGSSGLTRVWLPPGGDGRLAYAAGAQTLFRSTDGGSSWQLVLRTPSGTPDLVFTSAAAVFALADGQVFRTDAQGSAWSPISIGLPQRVQQLAASPDFVHDQTLFAAVATGDDDAAPDADSAGVMISHDAGASWTVSAAGLQRADGPARRLQWVLPSPTYAQDGTLFAGGVSVFRSGDRGALWQEVVPRPGPPSLRNLRPQLALSNRLAQDGLAVLTLQVDNGPTPASKSCPVYRSTDGGTTWTTLIEAHQYQGCGQLLLLQAAGQTEVYLNTNEWQHWTFEGSVSRPAPPSTPGTRLVAPATFATAQTLFAIVPTQGVLGVGPGLTATNAALPCPAAPGPTFSAVAAQLASTLGCAVDAERTVTVRRQAIDPSVREPYGPAVNVSIDGDFPYWYGLYEQYGTVRVNGKDAADWPDGDDQVSDQPAQLFETAVLVREVGDDGQPIALRLPLPTPTGSASGYSYERVPLAGS